jgi:hypothetical protein
MLATQAASKDANVVGLACIARLQRVPGASAYALLTEEDNVVLTKPPASGF